VGLTERAGDKVADYSGGMERRLNIAAGLLHRPRLLVLDEPTAGVDPQSRNAILTQVETLGGEGVAVLYTTHYMEEAERLCDRVGIIDQGRLVAEGTRRELVARVGERDRIELTAGGDLAGLAAAAARLEGVDEAGVVAGGVHLVARDGRRLLPRLLEAAEHAGAEVTSVELVEPDLEAVFLHLTGKALRDGPMLRTALLVAGKDLRQRLRDRSALVIAFVAPFVLASIIGLAFGGDDAFKATFAVADADKGPAATGFTDGVLAAFAVALLALATWRLRRALVG